MTLHQTTATAPPAPTAPSVLPGQVIAIAQEVWSSLLGLELLPSDAAPPAGESVTGVVTIDGAWRGSVQLRVPIDLARTAAAAMFMTEPDELGEEEIGDALGELANMIGGNIKSLLPEPGRLSLPSVTIGLYHVTRVPGAVLETEVTLALDTAPLRIAVWRL